MLSIFIWNYIQIEKERCSRVSADQMRRIDQLGGREQESKQETAKEELEGGGGQKGRDGEIERHARHSVNTDT